MKNVYPPLYTLNGEVIKEVDSVRYLGHIISSNGKDDKDIMRQCQQLYARGNVLLRKFHMCSMDVKVKLFNTYCSPMYTAHPRGVTKGRRRFLYHKTSSDDSGCGSAKVCLPQLCRMPKENDPGLCSTPHCEDDSEVLPTYSTESRGHLRVEHGLPRCSREHSRRFCGRLRRAKR